MTARAHTIWTTTTTSLPLPSFLLLLKFSRLQRRSARPPDRISRLRDRPRLDEMQVEARRQDIRRMMPRNVVGCCFRGVAKVVEGVMQQRLGNVEDRRRCLSSHRSQCPLCPHKCLSPCRRCNLL